MYKFHISDKYTTSDIGLEVTADSLEELFVGAAEGMFAITLGTSRRREESQGTEKLRLVEQDVEQLLVDWLSELLYRFDGEGKIPQEFNIDLHDEGGDFTLNAKFDFVLYDENSYPAEHEIKAVTYYKLKVKSTGKAYECQVVFDL